MTLPLFDPFTPEFLADPYAQYDRYRAMGPVLRGVSPLPALPGAWYVLGHAELLQALQDPRLGRQGRKVLPSEAFPPAPPGYAPFAEMWRRWLVFLDPPDHTRLRRLVQRTFTPEAVARLRPGVEALAHELIDRFVARGRVELVSEFALPLPVMVIAELLGVDPADRDELARWSDAMSHGNNLRRPAPPEVYERAGRAAVAMGEYVAAAAADRRQRPRQDLLTRLTQAEDEGQRLSEEELVATCVHLLTAGHETVVSFIAKSVLALIGQPAAAAPLRQGCVPLSEAVEELLRFDSPVQLLSRWALDDLRLGSAQIRRGDAVVLAVGAANRDPAAYAHPDRLDWGRRPAARHVTFGFGIHYCLGAALARMEAEIALRALLERLPGLRRTSDDLRYRDSVVFHGPCALELAFDPASAGPPRST